MDEIRVGLGFDVHPFVKPPLANANPTTYDLTDIGYKDKAKISQYDAVEEARIVEGSDFTEKANCLVLGGVRFQGTSPLVGHSDADVLAHAVCDAILGAAGMGDIGMMFPDDDDRFYNADSLWLLSEVTSKIAREGWLLVNADCSVITEEPKLAPFRDEMIKKLSEVAKGPVHVKATRPEKLGALGRQEGIACFAVALIGRDR